jgi:glucosyl-dolichyl phosphate glucuronosyltransferase
MKGNTLMTDALRVCVIIPTKNRPVDLQRAVHSVFAQTIASFALLIVDQSADEESRRRVEAEVESARNSRGLLCRLNYVYDPSITGLAMARNRAMSLADGDIWLFLDDDVVLEPDFVEQLLTVYRERPDAAGVSGIITNYPRPSLASHLWSQLFMRGPFHDERQPIYWRANRLSESPALPVKRFTGALMSFRAEAIRGRHFDEGLHGVGDGEDVDFCMGLDPGTVLLVTPRARLEHHHSPMQRLQDHWLRRHARGNLFLYQKHWNNRLSNKFCYAWLRLGYGIVALLASARRLSFAPFRALSVGLLEAREVFRTETVLIAESRPEQSADHERTSA